MQQGPRRTTTTTVKATTTTAPRAHDDHHRAPRRPPSPSGFVHPGVLVGRGRPRLRAGEDRRRAGAVEVGPQQGPHLGRFERHGVATGDLPLLVAVLPAAPRSRSSRPPAPANRGVHRGPPRARARRTSARSEHLDDARAAYTHALLWAYTGNQANANKAIEIMNAWSSTLTEIKFDQPRRPDNGSQIWANGKLQAGWGGSLFARAAEIIRYTGAGWSSTRRRPLRDDAPQRLPAARRSPAGTTAPTG